MTTFVHASDTHGRHRDLEVPEGDVFVHSGDALYYGSAKELADFLSWLRELPHRHKIYVPGNHDFASARLHAKGDLRRLCQDGVDILVNETVCSVDQVMVHGNPQTPPWPAYGMWSFQPIRTDWSASPKGGVDVLVTHGPPKGVLDENMVGIKCGDQALLDYVLELKPKYHLFGHIHPSNGVHDNGVTTFMNGAIVDDWHNVVNKPRVFKVEPAQAV